MDKSQKVGGHTAGPWGYAGMTIYDIEQHHVVATVGGTRLNNDKANANLIASAPELLEACKRAFIIIDESAPLKQGETRLLYMNMARDLNQAISKAEGRV